MEPVGESMEQLCKMADTYLSLSIGESTRKRYEVCLQRYIQFCGYYDLKAFPLQESNLILFASQLGSKSSHSNLKVHLSAIKYFAEIHGYAEGEVYIHSFRRLWLVVRGIKRCQGLKFSKPKRSPVTPDILRLIHFKLFNS